MNHTCSFAEAADPDNPPAELELHRHLLSPGVAGHDRLDGTGGVDGAGSHSHVPKAEALARVAKAFAVLSMVVLVSSVICLFNC